MSTAGTDSREASILIEQEAQIGTIVLNRPHHSNAFTVEMIDAWVKALEDLRSDPEVRVIVVTGAGKGFCSGAEVEILEKSASALERKNLLWQHIHRIPLLLESLDKPIIAMINGTAVGAGLDMALMCDLRIAAKSARLSEAYARMGLVPGDGGAYFLPRLVGTAKALELLWTADFISGERAEAIGLVNHVVADDELRDFTYALARKIANMPPLAVQMIKRAVYQSRHVDLRTALDLISSHMAVIQSTEDSQEALQAFREKRIPRYHGK